MNIFRCLRVNELCYYAYDCGYHYDCDRVYGHDCDRACDHVQDRACDHARVHHDHVRDRSRDFRHLDDNAHHQYEVHLFKSGLLLMLDKPL